MAARSVFRSVSSRAASFVAAEAKASCASSSPFRMASKKPLSQRSLRYVSETPPTISMCARLNRQQLRSPVELSFCVESMLPYHTATSSALLTSMLSVTRATCGWLPEGVDKTR